MTVKEARDQAGRCLLLRRQLVGRHGFDRGSRQDTDVAVLTFVQHHLAKGPLVVDGRDQAGRAGWKSGWSTPLAAGRLIVDFKSARYRIGPIAGREPVELAGQHAKVVIPLRYRYFLIVPAAF
jgi:hypothetical protein